MSLPMFQLSPSWTAVCDRPEDFNGGGCTFSESVGGTRKEATARLHSEGWRCARISSRLRMLCPDCAVSFGIIEQEEKP